MRDLKSLTAPFKSPAIQIVLLDAPSLSHFGGSPGLPQGTAWPERNAKRMGFLARLSLGELQKTGPIAWLPRSGALLFFYDVDEQPWGFDPKDRGSCAVLHVADLATPVSGTKAPAEGDFLARKCIGFRAIDTLPSRERPPVQALEFDDEEDNEYYKLRDAPFLGMTKHQVAGFPSAVQNDSMELECQLASSGLYCGDGSGYNDPRRKALEAGAKDWRLLLQFDSDDDLNVMWGDVGMLYFWVREADAAAGDFRQPWLILQCC